MKRTSVTTGQLIYAFGFPILLVALFFFLAGDWRWLEGWVWSGWFLALGWITTLYLIVKDPELLKERFQPIKTTNQVKAQAYLVYGGFIVYLVWFVIQPLEARRFHWTSGFPRELEFLGGLLLVGAFFFIFRAFADNTFASPLIRVQTERKQHVVSTGVYGFVRHPMYLGAVLMMVGKPLLLGSRWGLGLGALTVGFLVPRILGEEKLLTAELPGYAEYKSKVKFRLLPGVW